MTHRKPARRRRSGDDARYVGNRIGDGAWGEVVTGTMSALGKEFLGGGWRGKGWKGSNWRGRTGRHRRWVHATMGPYTSQKGAKRTKIAPYCKKKKSRVLSAKVKGKCFVGIDEDGTWLLHDFKRGECSGLCER